MFLHSAVYRNPAEAVYKEKKIPQQKISIQTRCLTEAQRE